MKKPLHPRPSANRPLPSLDAHRLEALALAYVARFATSAARLEAYLLRKLAARARAEDDGESELAVPREAVAALVARFVAAGYVDDRAFAAARSDGLQRRGYGRRRISAQLAEAGVSPDDAAAALPDARAERLAALALARRRRLGPFAAVPADRAAREKALAVLLRAGHRLDSARELVDARSIAAAEAWAAGDDPERLA